MAGGRATLIDGLGLALVGAALGVSQIVHGGYDGFTWAPIALGARTLVLALPVGAPRRPPSLLFRSQDVGRDQLILYEVQRAGKLPDWFAERCLSDDTVAAGIASRELVLDRRQARFLAELELDRVL